MKCFQLLKKNGGCEQVEFSKNNISVHLSGTHVREARNTIFYLFFCYIFNFLLSVLTPYATMAHVILTLCKNAEVVRIAENLKKSATNYFSSIHHLNQAYSHTGFLEY